MKNERLLEVTKSAIKELNIHSELHAHWNVTTINGEKMLECSLCLVEVPLWEYGGHNGKWNECPCCGAKMDEVVGDD